MNSGRKRTIIIGGGIAAAMMLGLVVGGTLGAIRGPRNQQAATADSRTPAEPRSDPNLIVVNEQEVERLKFQPVQLRSFRLEKTAVGRIAFNDDRTTAIFAPVQGRVARLIAKPGDVLQRGSPLLVIDSPDLVQANGDLIAASVASGKAQNQLALAERVAKRQKLLYEAGAGALKDLEQAESDLRNAQHDLKTAEGQLEAVRNRMRTLFGKTDTEIAKIETTHEVDRLTEVQSPIVGTVTMRKVSPGQFIRPDNAEPMFSIGDLSSMWLIANVAEIDIPLIKAGQEVAVEVMAFPGEVFRARITYVGASVDPTVRRVTVRAEISNPGDRLKPDMFASFRILTGAPTQAASVPTSAVVREGDGTMTVWVTADRKGDGTTLVSSAADRKRLVRRTVKVGLEQNGFVQILEGLQPGELVVTESALFLSNTVTSASSRASESSGRSY